MARHFAALALLVGLLSSASLAYPTPYMRRNDRPDIGVDTDSSLLARELDTPLILQGRGFLSCLGCTKDASTSATVPGRKGKAPAEDDPVAHHRERVKQLHGEIHEHQTEMHRLQKNIDHHAAKNPQPGTPAHASMQRIQDEHNTHQKEMAAKQKELDRIHQQIAAHDGAGPSGTPVHDKGKGKAPADDGKDKGKGMTEADAKEYARFRTKNDKLHRQIGEHRERIATLEKEIAHGEAQNHPPGSTGHEELQTAKGEHEAHRKAIAQKKKQIDQRNSAMAFHETRVNRKGRENAGSLQWTYNRIKEEGTSALSPPRRGS